MPQVLDPTVCPYCGAGCGFFIAVEKERATGIEYMPEHPASEGSLCSKGNAALEILYHPDRIRTPLKRHGDGWAKITWDEALDFVATRLKEVKEKHGPEKIGGWSSARVTNEENYLMQKMLRAAIGTNHVDHCARL